MKDNADTNFPKTIHALKDTISAAVDEKGPRLMENFQKDGSFK